jgi:hypothetical protein
MKYIKNLILIIAFSFISGSCNDNKCPEPKKPYNQEMQEFWLNNYGENVGFCGWVIQGFGDDKNHLLTFKPVNIPQDIRNTPFRKLKGKLEVLTESYSCKDGRGDPINGFPTETIQFVNILEWSVK